MLDWLRRNRARRSIGHELFERIVAQARSAEFYRDLGAADTMEGRFEMIVLHMSLVLQRLKREGSAGQRLGQTLMEALIAAMDDALRQIGIGDMGVPRRVQKAAAALAERTRDYQAGLIGVPGSRSLKECIVAHIYLGEASAEALAHAKALSSYISAADALLAAMPSEDLLAGKVAFPAPPAVPE